MQENNERIVTDSIDDILDFVKSSCNDSNTSFVSISCVCDRYWCLLPSDWKGLINMSMQANQSNGIQSNASENNNEISCLSYLNEKRKCYRHCHCRNDWILIKWCVFLASSVYWPSSDVELLAIFRIHWMMSVGGFIVTQFMPTSFYEK